MVERVFRMAVRPDVIKRSLIVSAVVGTVLNVINQGDALLGLQSLDLAKCILTYMVPFCVATYGAVAALSKLELKE